jgi:hypothetical protein
MYEVELGRSHYHLQGDMTKWCKDNIGKGGWLKVEGGVWSVDSAFGTTFFTFKNESDMTLFLLRWA